MDSGNSSSMQSSSGGGGGGEDQEEYGSHADQSLSALFNNNKATTISSNMAGQTQLDSLIANYFNTGWSTDTPLWSTTTTKPTNGSIPPPPPPPILFTNPLEQDLRVVSNTNTNTSSPICSVPTDKKNGLATTRNLKKRSRVSRRAPTTVLTTDTSNFRAMVQEFTGNPSTPFTGSSSFPRSRFDLLAPYSSSSRPLRPFPHNLIPPSSTRHHHYLNPPSTNYHQSLLLNMNNTQNISTSNGVGHVAMGTNFEGLQHMHGSDMVQRSDVYTTPVGSGRENNLGVVRNEGTVDLSWISSSD